MAFSPSSVIVTAGAVDTRTRDTISFPITFRPQSLTLYVRFVELLDVAVLSGFPGILAVGSSTNAGARLVLYRSGGNYACDYQNGFFGTTVTVSAASVVVGDRIELRLIVNPTGTIQLGLTRNEGAETLSAISSPARPIPDAWNSPVILFNAYTATSQGMTGFRNVEIMGGVRTLQEMRIRAGTN